MEVVFRVIGSEKDLDEVNQDEENIHFSFRPSETEILKLLHNCPNVRKIQLPDSYHKTLSKTTKTLLSMHNIEIIVGTVWGHRTDIDKHTKVEI